MVRWWHDVVISINANGALVAMNGVIDDTGECIEDQLTEKRFKSDLSTVLYEVRH